MKTTPLLALLAALLLSLAAALPPAASRAAPPPAASTEPKATADEATPVVVEGVGVSVEEARKDAIRNAVSKAVGDMVDAETLVENDELVKDQILTYSNGYVDSMEVLSTNADEEGLVRLRIRAYVRRTKLQAKLTEVIQTEADADGDSLFAELISRQDSIENAGKMFEKVFAEYREDLLLEAGTVMREDGRPEVEVDPGSGSVKVLVRLSVKDDAWEAWEKSACARLEKMCERRMPANASTDDMILSELPNFVVGASRFYFKEDYRETIKSALKTVPERQFVRVALVDRRGDTIAAEHLPTRDFSGCPLSPKFSCSRAPATADVAFNGLSLNELKSVSKIVCLVGPLNEILSADAERMFAYRRDHPNLTITLDDGVSFELAPLSPRLMMATTEVTQGLWQSVMGTLPNSGIGFQHGPDRPVVFVKWDSCQEFIKRLNDLSSIREKGIVFRLPRAEEWIAACRAGAKGDYCRLADGTEITEETLAEISHQQPREGRSVFPVGQKKPNAFGLYDMIGNNVGDWVSSTKTKSTWPMGCLYPCYSYMIGSMEDYCYEDFSGSGCGTDLQSFRLSASGRAD